MVTTIAGHQIQRSYRSLAIVPVACKARCDYCLIQNAFLAVIWIFRRLWSNNFLFHLSYSRAAVVACLMSLIAANARYTSATLTGSRSALVYNVSQISYVSQTNSLRVIMPRHYVTVNLPVDYPEFQFKAQVKKIGSFIAPSYKTQYQYYTCLLLLTIQVYHYIIQICFADVSSIQ